MCDTVCSVQPGRMLFAKNSDRPVGERQVIEAHPARRGGGTVRTQYLELADPGAAAVLGGRPTWLWGFEHGCNEHRVAIGNEKVWTRRDPATQPDALIGMDLVRLGLERASSAEEALEVITGLLAVHDQGGIADATDGEAYFSSFLLADPTSAWVLETSGAEWAARPVTTGAAISNRIGIGTDWTRASADLSPGDDWDSRRDPQAWTGLADVRLAVTAPAVTDAASPPDAAALARLLRHHGTDDGGLPDPAIGADGQGISVCMHVRDYQVTAGSLVCELPVDPAEPARAWASVGSPCVGVFVPVTATGPVPALLAEPATFDRFDALRRRVETTPWDPAASAAALAEVRVVLDPLETALWAEADASWSAGGDPGDRAEAWSAELDAALSRLGV